MNKQDIDREHLKDNIMKHIIFRFDYQGMIDSTDFVKAFNNKFIGYFESYSKDIHNKFDIKLNDLEDISNSLSIPVSEIIKQDIHVFSNNTFGTDKVSLKIGIYSTAMYIECIEYKTIDDYLSFIVQFSEFLFQNEPYISLKRFGLRKIGSNIYKNFDLIHKDFEKEYFSFKEVYFENYSLFRNRIEDVLYKDDTKLKINFIRNLDTGTVLNPDTDEEDKAFQVSLDLDAYLDEEALMHTSDYKKDLSNLIKYINNDILFNLFKNSVTKEFLNKNKK